MRTYELERLKYGIVKKVPEALITSIRVEEHLDFMSNEIAITLQGFIWGNHIQSIQYPRDWWQAFKERWYPKWLLAKYPVRYKVFEVDVKALYPDLKYDIPGHKARIVSQANQYITLKRWDD